MTNQQNQELIAQARADLDLDVPVYRVEVDTDAMTVTLHLYGGRVLTWYAPVPDAPPLPDGLTVAAGVGKKTADALNLLEIINLRQLAAHYQDDEVIELMSAANYQKLGTWLDKHNYFD